MVVGRLAAMGQGAAEGMSLAIAYSGSANGMLRSCHCPNAPWGGMAKRAWLTGRWREAAGPHALLTLDTGDLFPLEAEPARCALMLRLLSVMQVDAVALGDQELRGGLEIWTAINRDAGFWDASAGRSTFPWLSGGYRVVAGTGAPRLPAAPWRVFERNGLRVGIVSVVGREAWRFTPQLPGDLALIDPLYLISMFREATSNQVDLAIVLSHQGLDADRALAQRLDGIDLIIGGHSQSLISPPELVNGIAICQAGKNGENLGLLVLSRRQKDGDPRQCAPGSTMAATNGLHDAGAGNGKQSQDPFLPGVVETPRWRIAQQIVPLTTAVEDDPEAARLISAYDAAIEARNAARLAEPDPRTPPDKPRMTITMPSEDIVLRHGQRRAVAVRIANRGGAPLEVERVRSRSPWLEVRSFPRQIAPGAASNAVLEVVAGRIDRFFRCEFSIMANDPHRRVVRGSFPGRIGGPMPGILDVQALWTNLLQLSMDPGVTATRTAAVPSQSITVPMQKAVVAPTHTAAVPAHTAAAPAQAVMEVSRQELADEAPCPPASEAVLVEYFHSSGCRGCHEVEREILPAFAARFGDRITLRRYDVTQPTNYLRLARLQERLGVRSNEPVSIYIDGEIPVLGIEAIRANLERIVTERLTSGATPAPADTGLAQSPSSLQEGQEAGAESDGMITVSSVEPAVVPANKDMETLETRLKGFTVPAVMLAGLVDGVNPCAFATIVFFITLLGVSGVKSGRLLLVGAGYALAVFGTYLLMGFGAFRLLQSLSGWHVVAEALRWVMVALLVVLALLSFRDAWAFRRSGRPGDVALQLPDRLKRRMHEIMRTRLNPANLFMSALVIGCLVTLIEAVCTGQVYLPTLVLLSRHAGTRARAFPLLLLYNLCFVLPLVFVIIAAFCGTRNQRLLEWSRRNVVWGKVLMGLLFAGLAVVLLAF